MPSAREISQANQLSKEWLNGVQPGRPEISPTMVDPVDSPTRVHGSRTLEWRGGIKNGIPKSASRLGLELAFGPKRNPGPIRCATLVFTRVERDTRSGEDLASFSARVSGGL